MKRVLATSDFGLICPYLAPWVLIRCGIPRVNMSPNIEPVLVDEMLRAVALFPHLHVVSYFEGFYGYNRFIEGAKYYRLCTGCKDPDLEVSWDFEFAKYEADPEKYYAEGVGKILSEPDKPNPEADAFLDSLYEKRGWNVGKVRETISKLIKK